MTGQALLKEQERELTYIGAAAGCNAGALLAPALEAAQASGLAPDEARAAVEIVGFVKERAAEFLRRDAARVLPDQPAPDAGPSRGCCGPEPVASAVPVASGGGARSCG